MKQVSTFDNFIEEEFEDTKGAIRIRISKENRQHNGQIRLYISYLPAIVN
jgi:hypothetical protein